MGKSGLLQYSRQQAGKEGTMDNDTTVEMEAYGTQMQILELLANVQRHSAPIEVCIGRIQNGTVHQGILIKSAPPVAVEKLVHAGYQLEITREGVRVYKI